MIRPFDEDCSELSRGEFASQRCSWDYRDTVTPAPYGTVAQRLAAETNIAPRQGQASNLTQEEYLRAYGIDDRVLVVDGDFWRGMKIALGFTVVMSSILGVIGYRLFS